MTSLSPTDAPLHEKETLLAGETVLVIDDSPTILKVVQLVLAKAGFHVITAADGEAGLEAARERRPDVILLDFVMPKMNGYQFCRALSSDTSLKDVPVVLMSAKGDQVGERFVKVMGIVDYITKPFSPEAITAVVQHTIKKYGKPSPDASGPKPKVDLVDLKITSDGSTPDAADAEPALTGDLRVIPLAEVLQLLSAQSQSGCSRSPAAPPASTSVFARDASTRRCRKASPTSSRWARMSSRCS